jgi:hypothetical protein
VPSRCTHDVGLFKGSDFLVRSLGLVLALNGRDRAASFVGVVDVAGHVSECETADAMDGKTAVVKDSQHIVELK